MKSYRQSITPIPLNDVMNGNLIGLLGVLADKKWCGRQNEPADRSNCGIGYDNKCARANSCLLYTSDAADE